MSLKICSFNCQYTPTSQFQSFAGGNNVLVIPSNKLVIIKYISVDCIYSGPNNDIVINDFYFNLQLLDIQNNFLFNNRIRVINAVQNFGNYQGQYYSFNKKKPLLKINELGKSFRIFTNANHSIGISLNKAPISANDKINYTVNFYYD
jgi:hypothetical protein